MDGQCGKLVTVSVTSISHYTDRGTSTSVYNTRAMASHGSVSRSGDLYDTQGIMKRYYDILMRMSGAGCAMLGKEGAMACTVAVETVIGEHYDR